jgi:molybdopterin-guanine dinucleotide biosynthesis protein A
MAGPQEITGVILAGGRASRMGGEDKGLLEFAGRPLIEHVLERLRPQVGNILINANRNVQRYAAYAPVVTDTVGGFAGPLAGMLAAMESIDSRRIMTVPCDGPYLADDLVARMASAMDSQGAAIAVAHDGRRLQPVYALIDTELRHSLRAYLDSGGRKIDLWYAQHHTVEVDFSDHAELFININRPEELSSEEQRLRETRT